MIEKLHPLAEAATILHVSKHTLRSWYYQGRLAGIKIGRRVMFAEDVIQQFIDQGKKLGGTYSGSRN